MLGIRIVMRHKDLLFQLLIRNLTSRYKGSVLGLVWSFAQPLMLLCVYTFVFGVVFKARWDASVLTGIPAAFPLIMFCGMAVYNIFSESVNTSTTLIVNNASLVKKVIFPLEILPLANVLTSLVFSLAWFVLLFTGVALFTQQVTWSMLYLPLPLIPLLLLSAGASFFLASLGVYLRDIAQVVGIFTQVLFFMTPIFYPLSLVPEHFRWLLQINPLTYIVEEVRWIFLYGQTPHFLNLAVLTVFSMIVFQLGLIWFTKTKKGFADVL